MERLRKIIVLLTIILALLLAIAWSIIPSLLTKIHSQNHSLSTENIIMLFLGIIIGFGLNMIAVMFFAFFQNPKKRDARIRQEIDFDIKRMHILQQIDGLVDRYDQTEKLSRSPRKSSKKLLLAEKNR